MNMADKPMNPDLLAELQQLALLSEADIDTSDIPEAFDWIEAKRGLFTEQPLVERRYDVRAIANWFLSRGEALGLQFSNLAMNKLVYFAIERALVDKQVLLTPARIEAWSHGPVIRELYHAFQSFGDRSISGRASMFSPQERAMVTAVAEFDSEDENLLEAVFNTYGKLPASRLRQLSHIKGGPWDAVWHYLGKSNPGMEITPAIIFEHAPEWRPLDGK